MLLNFKSKLLLDCLILFSIKELNFLVSIPVVERINALTQINKNITTKKVLIILFTIYFLFLPR